MLLLFEDERWQNFAPLLHTRPLYAARCGAFTPHERLHAWLALHRPAALTNGSHAPAPVFGLSRAYLHAFYSPESTPERLLGSSAPLTLVNARALTLDWLPALLDAPVDTVYISGDSLLGARLSPALASAVLYYLHQQRVAEALDELHRFARIEAVEALLCTYPWDWISQAGPQLERDLPLLAARLPRYSGGDPQVTVRGTHVYVAPSAQLDSPLVLDARDGPVYIDEQAHIEPFSFIQGPAYIGPKTLIASARIRGETSFGPVCRVGGEVEASTFHGFSNKHHDGFLGHSWVGEWVNIGAMTTNSDLKNNYGSVRVLIEPVGQIDSGIIKLGCFLADHVKLGIGVHLSGGTIIGVGSNMFGVHMLPKTVPPFTWGSDVFYEYRIDRMIQVAHTVMGRRKQALTPAYEHLLRTVFALTRAHRGGNEPPMRRYLRASAPAEPPALLHA